MDAIAMSDLYLWGAAASLLVSLSLLVFLAWWALFSDRPGDRRRCPQCWYDLTWSSGMTCPECGFEAQSEKDLGRTRRRTGLATLAILGCVAIGLFTVDRANTRGWMSYLPTRVVLAAVPLFSNPNGPVPTDLLRRIRSGELDREQWVTLLDRCVIGDGGARPTTDAWIGKYGRYLDSAQTMAVKTDDEEWRETLERILFEVPPRVELKTRTVWPSGIAPTVDVFARSWWPEGTQWRIRAQPHLPGAAAVEHALLDERIQRRSYSLRLPALPAGRHDVVVEITVSRRSGPGADWTTLETKPTSLAMTVTEDVSASLEPVTGEEFDDAVRQVFQGGLTKFYGGSLPVRVNVDVRNTFGAAFDDVAMGVRVEVSRNGKAGRRLDMWWMAGAEADLSRSAWEVPFHDDAVLGAPIAGDEVWTIHARGDLELALRIDGATRYWAGEITLDVPVRLRNAPAPERGWVVWEDEKESKR